MDELDLSGPEAQHHLIQPLPDGEFPFFDDTKITGQVRSFYFDREKFDDTHSEAWTLGGSLSLKTGYLADFFRVGSTVYTSQRLYGPLDRDGTSLLRPDQKGYTVLGQLFGEFKFTDQIFGAVGRKLYNTPYINAHDVRMTPKTFEGATLYGNLGGEEGEPSLKFGGGYISKIKEWNSDKFVWMSEDAGAKDVERGVFVGGGNFEHKNFSIGAANYYSDDILNIFYTESKITVPLGEVAKMKFSGQYSDQRSTGRDLLKGMEFSTGQWGAKSDLIVGAITLTVALTDVVGDFDMQNPWSGHPGYTGTQVRDFNRADESAILFKAAADLAQLLEGLSAYALVVHGFDVDRGLYDEDEVDLNLQWKPKPGELGGPDVRVRYAHIGQRGGGSPEIHDFRVIFNWDF